MAQYMYQVAFTAEAWSKMAKEPQNRESAIRPAIEKLGGKLAIGAGARSLKRPEAVFWGGYSGYFADPDGHVWELAHNPFWTLKEDGTLTLPSLEKSTS